MENFTLYTFNEIIALITSVIIGTGAYIAFIWKEKKVNITIPFIFAVLGINTFITYIASEVLKIWNWGGYRTLVLPLAAFMGQYIVDWFSKRYPKIFDAGIKKVGLDIDNIEENEEIQSCTPEDEGDVPLSGENNN